MSTKEGYFRALSKLSIEMGRTEDKDKTLHLIVSAAMNTLKAKAAVIFLRDEDSENFIITNRPPRSGFPVNTFMLARRMPLK
jgi:hypothetical protein